MYELVSSIYLPIFSIDEINIDSCVFLCIPSEVWSELIIRLLLVRDQAVMCDRIIHLSLFDNVIKIHVHVCMCVKIKCFISYICTCVLIYIYIQLVEMCNNKCVNELYCVKCVNCN